MAAACDGPFVTKLSIRSFKAGATTALTSVMAVSTGGLSMDSLMGALTSITSSGLSSFGLFSGSGGLTFECFDKVHPLILRNSVKSTDFFLQQDHPL